MVYCIQCGREATDECSACRCVTYCSTTCQRRHWLADHRFHCRQSPPHQQRIDSAILSRNVTFPVRLRADIELTARLGQGGFGSVYKGRQTNNIVVKVFDVPSSVASEERREILSSLVQEFVLQEIVVGAAADELCDNVAVCKGGDRADTFFSDADAQSGQRSTIGFSAAMLFPYEDVLPLADYIGDIAKNKVAVSRDRELIQRFERGAVRDAEVERRVRLDWLGVYRDIVADVVALHRFSIAHQDLKPDNILITARSIGASRFSFKPIIIDFGLACIVPAASGGNDDDERNDDKSSVINAQKSVFFENSRRFLISKLRKLDGNRTAAEAIELLTKLKEGDILRCRPGRVGTRLYIDPRFIDSRAQKKKRVDARAAKEQDMYALGVILYEFVLGHKIEVREDVNPRDGRPLLTKLAADDPLRDVIASLVADPSTFPKRKERKSAKTLLGNIDEIIQTLERDER